MKIRFYDKKTGQDAVLSNECTEFVISADGQVKEFLEQGYASHYDLMGRDDVGIEITPAEFNVDDAVIVCKNGDGPNPIGSSRCADCDDWLYS